MTNETTRFCRHNAGLTKILIGRSRLRRAGRHCVRTMSGSQSATPDVAPDDALSLTIGTNGVCLCLHLAPVHHPLRSSSSPQAFSEADSQHQPTCLHCRCPCANLTCHAADAVGAANEAATRQKDGAAPEGMDGEYAAQSMNAVFPVVHSATD